MEVWWGQKGDPYGSQRKLKREKEMKRKERTHELLYFLKCFKNVNYLTSLL